MKIAGGAFIYDVNHFLTAAFSYLARVRLVYAGGIKHSCRRQEMTNFDLDSVMAQEGYIPGIPAWGVSEDYDGDAELCTKSTCQMCGHKGLDIRPFLDWFAQSYKAFAECHQCGSIKEI